MTRHAIPPLPADALRLLGAEGRSPEAVEAIAALDRAMFQWHQRILRGEMVGRILGELGIDLELAEFRALTAAWRRSEGIGREAPEPATVGALAEELLIDPSRASRLAADLVAKGFLVREADQGDGRRSVLVPTARGRDALVAFRDRKWAILAEAFAGWSDADVTAFAALFGRYREAMERALAG